MIIGIILTTALIIVSIVVYFYFNERALHRHNIAHKLVCLFDRPWKVMPVITIFKGITIEDMHPYFNDPNLVYIDFRLDLSLYNIVDWHMATIYIRDENRYDIVMPVDERTAIYMKEMDENKLHNTVWNTVESLEME